MNLKGYNNVRSELQALSHESLVGNLLEFSFPILEDLVIIGNLAFRKGVEDLKLPVEVLGGDDESTFLGWGLVLLLGNVLLKGFSDGPEENLDEFALLDNGGINSNGGNLNVNKNIRSITSGNLWREMNSGLSLARWGFKSLL